MVVLIWAAVQLFASTGAAPGLGGATHGLANVVGYTTEEMVSARCPRAPPPSSECTDAALVLRSLVISVIDSYVGSPWMGGMTGCGKLLMRASNVVAVMLVSVA